jgi:hypothetical protein
MVKIQFLDYGVCVVLEQSSKTGNITKERQKVNALETKGEFCEKQADIIDSLLNLLPPSLPLLQKKKKVL